MDNITEAIDALTLKPLKSTSFQRIQILSELKNKYADMPQPLRFGAVMYELLDRVDVPVCDCDLIAGRCPDKTLDDGEEELYGQFTADERNLYKTTVFDTGHCTLDWEELINSGLTGLRERAERSLNSHSEQDKKVFLRGAIAFYDAVINYISRYAAAAELNGNCDLAVCLRALTKNAPKNFRQALQLCWIVTLIDCAYVTANPTLCVGRLDRYLYPLYKAGLNDGSLTREEAGRLITDYYCKHNLIMGRGEHQLGDETNTTGWSRILNFDAPQYLALAGTDENGSPVVNDLTQLMVECIVPRFKNPVVVIRYYEGMANDYPLLWTEICKKALASSSMMIYNDNDTIAAFTAMGVPEKDARNYEHFGCNWAGLGKDSCWMLLPPHSNHFYPEMSDSERSHLATHYMRTNSPGGWAEDFMLAFKSVASGRFEDIDQLYDAFLSRLRAFVRLKLERIKLEIDVRRRRPSAVLTLGDCFRIPPIEKAEANNASAAKYYFEIQSFLCIASVIDCFVAVDQLVCKEKRLTARQLIEAVEADFNGFDEILAMCRNAEKFGSDGELSNFHAEKLAGGYLAVVREEALPYAEKYNIILSPSIQSDTRNVSMGALFGATPDGRKAGEPFSLNSRPSLGSCTGGITGMLSSLLHLPMRGFASGSLNLDVQPEAFKDEMGLTIFKNLLKAYFDNGGLHVQVSCQDVNQLIDAKAHPEKHRDLMVRVTGYSGIFVDMARHVQDYVIERMKK